jgi:DNA-binding NtrC family response regulator
MDRRGLVAQDLAGKPVNVDVRVILASNQPLEDLVASGEFRQDLYYRINVVMIQLPALRARISDIAPLAQHFLALKSTEVGKQIVGFTDETLGALREYSYPGNVRELENIIERAVVLTKSTRITIDDLPPHVVDERQSPGTPMPGRRAAASDWNPIPLRRALVEP